MKKRLSSLALIAAGGLCVVGLAMLAPDDAEGADHTDSPAPVGNAAADINDLYAWMNTGATNVNLIMTVSPFAAAGTEFGTDVTYVFHVNSRSAFGATTGVESAEVRCQFYDTDAIECWVIANDGSVAAYVEGDPSATAGLTNGDGNLRVYAGQRNDPFFFELGGFLETADFVRTNAGTLPTPDAAGCFPIDVPTSTALTSRLTTDGGDTTTPAADDLAGQNVLALVIEVDKTLLNTGGDVLGVWASTHAVE